MNETKRGMTLVEVLVATAVLALALVPVSDLLMSNSRQTRFTIERLQASGRARMILDRYRCLSASQLAALFPADGSGSAHLLDDTLLDLDSDLTATAALTADENKQAAAFEERFADNVSFLASNDGRSGQLVVRVGWESTGRVQSLSASEWIVERRRQ